MSEQVKKHLKVAFYIAIAIFIICSLISTPDSFKDISSNTGIAVLLTIIISGLYEKWGWRLNPFEKTPKLSNEYEGTIEFKYNGKTGNKNIRVYVKQSLFHLEIKLVTDETVSSTITSKIIKENGNYVLYYTYITNPKSKYSDLNPIQFGTCRFIIDDTNKLTGIYWTNRQSKGDIFLSSYKGEPISSLREIENTREID